MSSNIERIRYTMMHRRAIRAIIEVYVLDSDKEEMMKRYFNHDMDKVVMNLLNVPFNDIKRIHRENNPCDFKARSVFDYGRNLRRADLRRRTFLLGGFF